MTRFRGFTLMEVMVYCVVIGLFAAIFFVALPTRRNTISEELNRSLVQSNLISRELRRRVANSAQGGVFIHDNGLSVVILSALDGDNPNLTFDQSGDIQWRSWHYYSLENGQLLHHIAPLAQPKPFSLIGAPEELTPLSDKKSRALLSGVETFSVVQEADEFAINLSVLVDGSRHPVTVKARPGNH